MANDFSSDSTVFAHWRFEPGALTTDTKGLNALTAYNSPTSETSEFVEGSGCVRLDMRTGQYFKIADASLSANFPLKSSDATKTMSMSVWFKLESYQSIATSDIIGKWSATAARQCWLLYVGSNRNLFFAWKYNNTTGAYYPDTGITIGLGKWYHVGVRLDGVNKWLRITVFDLELKTSTVYAYTPTNALYMGAADLCIGAREDSTAWAFHGLIDETVISSYSSTSWENLLIMREQRYSGTGTNLIVTNDFSGDTSAKALWRFEPAGLTADSLSTNHLTASASSPTSDTTYYREGSGGASFADASSQYFTITDANLAAGFPLKSGDTTKKISVCFWFRPTTVPAAGNYDNMWVKYDTNSKRSLAILLESSQVRVYYGYSPGSAAYTISAGSGFLVADTWYFVAVAVDGVARTVHIRVFSEYHGKIVGDVYSKQAADLFITDAAVGIGCSFASGAATTFFNGKIDGVVVFNRILSSGEMDAIMEGRYSDTNQALQAHRAGVQVAYRSTENRNIRCVRPERGCDSFSGASWDQATSSWTQPYTQNEIVLVEKCAQTAQAGTLAATNNSRTVSTTNDLSAALPQYSIVQLDSDDAIYMIRAATTNTLSLYRPYRGVTGSGKVANKITLFRSCSSILYSWTLDSVPGQTIDVRGGINTSTNLADGFSVYDHGHPIEDGFSASGNEFWKLSRVGIYDGYQPYLFSGCLNFELEKVYAFKGYAASPYIEFSGNCSRLTARELIYEGGSGYQCFLLTAINNSEFIDCEAWAGDTTSIGIAFSHVLDVNFTRFRQGHARFGIQPGTSQRVTFTDCEFGADTTNSISDFVFYTPQTYCDFIFRNCMLNSATLISAYTASYYGQGQIAFERFNQTDGDHRTYYLSNMVTPTQTSTDGLYRAIVSADSVTYRIAAPSAKVAFYGASRFPVVQSFIIPCEAGVARTVSVYIRKNSAYGGTSYRSFLPYMKIRYLASASLIAEAIATMPDTVDTWSFLSAGVTPFATGVIEVELNFWSYNSGAIAWYDDFDIS